VQSQQKKSARAKQGPAAANLTPKIGNSPFEDVDALKEALGILRQAQQLLERQLRASGCEEGQEAYKETGYNSPIENVSRLVSARS
jgi:hypothetical protein